MVQPVRGGEPELKLLPLIDLEVLEHGQIAIEVSRGTHVRHLESSQLSITRRGEAVWIEVLTRVQVFARITNQLRNHGHITAAVLVGSVPGTCIDSVRPQSI